MAKALGYKVLVSEDNAQVLIRLFEVYRIVVLIDENFVEIRRSF